MKTEQKSMEERTGLRSLELFYRPVFDWEEQSSVCYQSQLRINGANMGILFPWQYLPVAERTDQCCKLSKWAVEQACSDLAVLWKRGVEFEWVSVYVSLRLLALEEFATFVEQTLSAQDLEPKFLCIELPPSVLSRRDEKVIRTIGRLREAGVRFLISGFGSEDCPVMQLAQVPVDIVLLDASVSEQLSDESQPEGRSRAAACSLVSFIKGQGLGLIADGIATRSQADAAAQCGCTLTTGDFAGVYVQRRGIRA